MFDFKKYDRKVFNKNPSLNQKIKALFLYFDKFVLEQKLNYFQKQRLINTWILSFIEHEEYEIAEAFKQRKLRSWKKWRKAHRLLSIKLFWRVWRIRFRKLINILK